jgi:transaldolase
MSEINSLKCKIFADGANIKGMLEMASRPDISGLTTNPTLMRKAGVLNYFDFSQEVLKAVTTKPVSFEVFSDDLYEMKRQAIEISSWAENVYVKIPITNTKGQSTNHLVGSLTNMGIKVNVTAILTEKQVEPLVSHLNPEVPCFVSVFAGRIADTGRNPIPIMEGCLELLSQLPKSELIWASPREVLNVYQASSIGCHIITATNDILAKLNLREKDLDDYSLETVKMFHDDAVDSGFVI